MRPNTKCWEIHSTEGADICVRARRGKFAALKGRQFTAGGERVKRALPPVNVGTRSVYRASSARPALAAVIDDACDHKCPPPAPSHGRGIFIITRLPGVTLRSPPAVNCRPFRAQKTACERGRICRAYARYHMLDSGRPPEHEVLGNPQRAACLPREHQ